MIAKAVLLLIGVVGVARAEAILELLVVARARIGVLDQQADRRAGGAPFEHAREDAHRIALATLADEVRSAGAAPIDIALQIRLAERQPRRTAVDDAAERRAVAFAKAGDREQPADGIARHPTSAAGRLVRRSSNRQQLLALAAQNTPPPPRSNASQMNGSRGNARRSAASVLPTSTIRIRPGFRCAAASRKMIRTASRPSVPAASARRGSCRYSAGKPSQLAPPHVGRVADDNIVAARARARRNDPSAAHARAAADGGGAC